MTMPSDRQAVALRYLAAHPGAWPADMGHHLSGPKRADRRQITAQGAGFCGGTMLAGLRAQGWASRAGTDRNGQHSNAHAITRDGKAALAAYDAAHQLIDR